MERRQGIRHEWAGRIFEVVQILRRTIPSTCMVNHLLSRCDGVEEVTNNRKSFTKPKSNSRKVLPHYIPARAP